MCLVQAYNLQADGLQLIPASAKRAAGIQYEINLDRGGTTASELVDVDIKASLLHTSQLQSIPQFKLKLFRHAQSSSEFHSGSACARRYCAMSPGKGTATSNLDR